MRDWHPEADPVAKHKIPYKGPPLFWTRRAPEAGESLLEWLGRTESDSYVCEIEEISWMLANVVVMELVAEKPPLFVMQWGPTAARLALRLFPFDPAKTLSLNGLICALYKMDGRTSLDPYGSSPIAKGLSLRWLGQKSQGCSMWTTTSHTAMSEEVSSFEQRLFQSALKRDERNKVTKWEGSSTQMYLDAFVFDMCCADFLLLLMAPEDHQLRKERRAASRLTLKRLLKRINKSPMFVLQAEPIIDFGDGDGGGDIYNAPMGSAGGDASTSGHTYVYIHTYMHAYMHTCIIHASSMHTYIHIGQQKY